MKSWLELASGDRVPLKATFYIGRSPDNSLVLPGKQVSRKHAMIHLQRGGQYWIVDLGSANGVYLNGVRVRHPAPLRGGDQVKLGGHEFAFSQQEDDAESGSSFGNEASTDQTILAEPQTGDHWLMVADIENFTPMSKTMPGEELAKKVGTWIVACKEIVETNGGLINQYLGDGFLAFWPRVDTPSNQMVQAIRAMRHLQKTCDLPFRMVVHHGEVTIDTTLSEGEDSLIGLQVNFTFRMEKLAGQLQSYILLSEPAAKKLEELGGLVDMGNHELKGIEGQHKFYGWS